VEWGYPLARVCAYPLRLTFRIPQAGFEHVPRTGPVILASNHVSFIDPLMICWLGERTRRKIRFLAMSELWQSRLLRFFLVHTKQIPVSRQSAFAGGSLAAAARALDEGECVCIFPEGGISGDLEPAPGKTGVARLAATSGVPVTPVGTWGGHRLFTAGRPRRLRLGVAITIVAGPPVAVGPDEDVFDATDRIMAAVADCVADARRIYPQQPKRKEGSWWVRPPETAVMRPTARTRTRSRWS